MKNFLKPSHIANIPIPYLSVSAMRAYLSDRQSFFRRYVRLEFDEKASPALVEGKALHSIIEAYWKTKQEGGEFNWDEEIKKGVEIINQADITGEIDWGKTGSFDKSSKTVFQAANFYKENPPEYGDIVAVEKKYISDFEDLDDDTMPIPLKGFCDLIVKEKGNYIIIDHKLVTMVKNQDEIVPVYELQAAAYWFLTRKEYGVNPKKMIFDQIKKTKSRNGDPQIVPYVIEYTPAILNRFLEIYRRILKELSGQPLIDENTGIAQFLPNPFAVFGWEESWEDFCEEVESGKQWTVDELKVIRENRYSDKGVEALDL
jgi:RecB family exonuclease